MDAAPGLMGRMGHAIVRLALDLTVACQGLDTSLLLALALVASLSAGVATRCAALSPTLRQTLWALLASVLYATTTLLAWILVSRYTGLADPASILGRMAGIR